jgi:hypothetical protein
LFARKKGFSVRLRHFHRIKPFSFVMGEQVLRMVRRTSPSSSVGKRPSMLPVRHNRYCGGFDLKNSALSRCNAGVKAE